MSKARELAQKPNQSTGRKNLIINGAMQVAQRGASRSFGASYNALDRWATAQYQLGGHEQVSVTDTSVPAKKAIRVTSSSTSEASSGSRMGLAQMVESRNCDFLAGKTVTLSFYIRFSAATITGTSQGFAFQLTEYDAVDPSLDVTGETRSNSVIIPNGSYPTSWTKYTKTVTCASTMKNLGVRFLFSDLFNTTNNSDSWYEVTGVQIEVGSVDTEFEHRSYGEELALCQRYFYKTYRTVYGGDYNTNSFTCLQLPVTMRAIPTVTATNNKTVLGSYHSEESIQFYLSGNASAMSAYAKADAEL